MWSLVEPESHEERQRNLQPWQLTSPDSLNRSTMEIHTNQDLCSTTNSSREQILCCLGSTTLLLYLAHIDADGDKPTPR